MNQIVGTGENETIFGTDGADIITGGRGDDVLNGLLGNDTYRFNVNFGKDKISYNPFQPRDYDTAFDQIKFGTGLNAEDVTATRVGDHLHLDFVTGEQLIVHEHFNLDRRQIDKITFGDGTVWYPWKIEQQLQPTPILAVGTAGADTLAGEALNDTLSGRAGFDYLFGFAGNDILTGGRDNDIVVGGNGSDTYRYNPGDGRDAILDMSVLDDTALGNGFDQLILGAGITPSDITVKYFEGAALLYMADDAEIFLVDQFTAEGAANPNIDRIVFDDGTIWYPWKIAQLSMRATAGDDTLVLLDGNSRLSGLAGNDALLGSAGDDQLLGGAGNDRLTGGGGNDTLTGGSGNDRLEGEEGNDTYRFDAGFGFDIIEMASHSSGADEFDQIVFGTNISPDQVKMRVAGGSDLAISIGEDTVLVSGYFIVDDPLIGRLKFADGTIWYHWKILTLLDFTGTETANDLFALDSGSEVFGLGGDDTLYGGDGDDRLLGGADNDLLLGGSGNDTLIGGSGNDKLFSSAGNDSFEFALGHGNDNLDVRSGTGFDQIRFTTDVSSADVNVSRIDEHLVLTNIKSGDSIRVEAYFGDEGFALGRVTFRDGTIWYRDQLEDMARQANDAANQLFGTDENDTIAALGGNDLVLAGLGNDNVHGGADDDRIYGNNGEDSLNGGAGNDALYGEAGNDTLIGGSGNDTMTGREGNDTYVFDAGFGSDIIINSAFDYPESDGSAEDFDRIVFTDAYTPDDITVIAEENNTLALLASDGAQVRVNSHFVYETYRINEVSFADGTIWAPADLLTLSRQPNGLDNRINGTNEVDLIDGLGGDDTIYGVGGNDTLSGGEGQDILYGQAGDDILYGEAGNDVLHGGRGGDDLQGGDGNDWFHPGGDAFVDTIDGGDGVDTLSLDMIVYSYAGNIANLMTGEAGAIGGTMDVMTNIENLVGSPAPDILTGDDGANVLKGGWGDDTLNGNGGDDHIYGGENNDTIDGGDGYDRVYFSSSSRNYDITTQDGVTTINNTGRGWDGDDTLTNVEVLVFSDTEIIL